MKSPIILAYNFDKKGNAIDISGEDIAQQTKNKKLTWLHLNINHPESKLWITKELTYLEPFVINALLAPETRPRITQIGDGLLVNLRGINLNKGSKPEDMISIRFWIDGHRIISLERRHLKVVEDIEKRFETNKVPNNSGDFIIMLVSKLFKRMEPVLLDIDELSDDLEEKILDTADIALRQEIIDVRKKAILYRRYMAPQKEAINKLRLCELSWLDDNHKRHIQEEFDRITRYVEDLDAIRERAQIVKDELSNLLADKLNKNMYVLSVIAAIFLPLGFLTGLLGVNLGGIPGTDTSSAFWGFCVALALVIIVQIIIFKKLKWF